MKYNGDLRAFSFSYPASSLYSLIADGNYRPTNLGRNTWKGLISGSSLQRNCNKEGFNARIADKRYGWPRARIGIIANQENDCNTPDSFIGLGTYFKANWGSFHKPKNAAGNLGHCIADNGDKNIKAMGYILVR